MRIPQIVLSICAVAVLTTAFAAGASAAPRGDALQTALGYVKGQHKALGLKASDLGDMVVSDGNSRAGLFDTASRDPAVEDDPGDYDDDIAFGDGGGDFGGGDGGE